MDLKRHHGREEFIAGALSENYTQHDTLFWEHEGGKAARIGDWKIAALKNEQWELFNFVEDRTETNNLAFKHPDKVEAFAVLSKDWYIRVNK